MRRVLVVDDLRQVPLLLRLRPFLTGAWDFVVTLSDQVESWKRVSWSDRAPTVVSLESAGEALGGADATEVVVAAISESARNWVSRVSSRGTCQLFVLPDAAQTADWAYSLYPLSESKPPRIQAIPEYAVSPAANAFRLSLNGAGREASLSCVRTVVGAVLNQAVIERELFRDLDFLQSVVGQFEHLIAVTVPVGAEEPRSVTVTLGGRDSGTVSWVIQAGAVESWELGTNDPSGLRLRRDDSGEYGLVGGPKESHPVGTLELAPWDRVLRAFDVLAGLRRSLKRKRLVELETETISERAQFKSLMSASGCGLLLATLLGAVVLLGAGAALDPRDSQQRTSEKAGLVFRDAMFATGTNRLNPDGEAEWPGVVRRLGHTSAPVLIERTFDDTLDQQRRIGIIDKLGNSGIAGAAGRVEIFDFKGDLFLASLTIAWVILFLPLGAFLGMQFLLLATPRPDSGAGERER